MVSYMLTIFIKNKYKIREINISQKKYFWGKQEICICFWRNDGDAFAVFDCYFEREEKEESFYFSQKERNVFCFSCVWRSVNQRYKQNKTKHQGKVSLLLRDQIKNFRITMIKVSGSRQPIVTIILGSTCEYKWKLEKKLIDYNLEIWALLSSYKNLIVFG